MNALDQLFKWLSPTLATPKGTRRLSEPVPTNEDNVSMTPNEDTVPLEGDETPVDPPVGQDDRPDEPDGAGPVAV